MKRIITSIVSVIIIALLAILGLNIYRGHGPRDRVKAPDGSPVVVEEISYYVHGGKVFGKVFKPDGEEANDKRPLLIYFHEPLKTGFPESILKSMVPDGINGYASGFRGSSKEATSIVKRLRNESFVESDMVFLAGDSATSDEVLLAASKLGQKIQGLILIEPNPTGKAKEIYLRYGKEFLTIDSSQKGDAFNLIEDYLEERGALK